MKRYTFTTYEETIDTLKKLSAETRIPVSRHIEEALQDLFKKYDNVLNRKETNDKND